MRWANCQLCLLLMALCLGTSFSGCISIPTTPTPRFYALCVLAKSPVSKKANLPSTVIIGVGPVKIPEYLDRPQIVTTTQQGMLEFAPFDRWGESLETGIGRLMRENLTMLLPKASLILYPWNLLIPVKYQIVVEVIQCRGQLDGQMLFIVQWTVIDVQKLKTVIIKRSAFHQSILPHNYLGLVKALSMACASLTRQIADTIQLF